MNKKILIIEDERQIADILSTKLNQSGFLARAVFDGREGLKALEGEPFDLILLDILMPTLDGWEFLRQIRAKGIETPVVILSNLSQTEDKEKGKALGAVGFLVKSDVGLEELAEKINKFIT